MNSQQVQEVASEMRVHGDRFQTIGEKLKRMAKEIEGLAADIDPIKRGNGRISSQGMAKIRASSAAMWKPCPVGCKAEGEDRPKNHRLNHPHITGKKQPHLVAKRKKAA